MEMEIVCKEHTYTCISRSPIDRSDAFKKQTREKTLLSCFSFVLWA